jgi:hypothetical protein
MGTSRSFYINRMYVFKCDGVRIPQCTRDHKSVVEILRNVVGNV